MRTLSLAHRLVPFAVFGAVALSVPALAQSPTNGTASSGAQLTVYPACTTQPSKDDSEVAHGAYIAGKRSFDENDYPTAIQYFKDAYRRDCTKYELLNIISRSYELKGDKPEAINALETYLKRAPSGDPSLESIQKRLANLKAQAAAEASAKPSASASTSASVEPSASASAAPPPTSTASSPPPARGHSLPPYFLMAGGVVALGVGIPLAIVGAGGVSDANSKITSLGCDPDSATCQDNNNVTAAQNLADGPRRTGQIEEGVGVALIGVGAAAVIGGLVWHFVEPTGPASTQSGANIGVRPDARPGYAGMSVGGTF